MGGSFARPQNKKPLVSPTYCMAAPVDSILPSHQQLLYIHDRLGWHLIRYVGLIILCESKNMND